ncbi:MAG TPA: GntR family transcriptional regulator, partial [Salinisphaeraceae bacterium]|nr:GntR family transcriptional regulator [Salinisphaeraceae bacterium]
MTKEAIELGWTPEEPTALGVARAVSRAIRDGVLAPGTKLPPIRAVACQLQLSPTTINSAWNLLARSGAIHTDGRRGTTIADVRSGSRRYQRALDGHRLFTLDLSAGIPDARLLPDLAPALQHLTTTATPGG